MVPRAPADGASDGHSTTRRAKRSEAGDSSLKKPTIRVVAAKAGVAVSTVSRYLNDDSVSPRMKARVSRVIESLGYKPSRTARNLSLGLKGCIGVVVDSIQDPWFTQLLTGMEEELQVRDVSLMLLSLELRDKYDPAIAFEWIDERRVDGLIIAKCHRRDKALLEAAIDAHVPIVAVAPDEARTDLTVLRADNIAAGRTLGAHLAELGHTRIAFAGGPRASIESRQRLQGLRGELTKRAVQMRDEDISFQASYEAEEGAAFAQTFLSQPMGATAVVFGNDALAIGFIRAAQQRGIRVPDDLSVAGFDGIPEGARSWPGLTTMAQPMREMGRDACRRLFTAITASAERTTVEYSMTLVVRESTSRPRTASRTERSDQSARRRRHV
ncbi:MAG TPA: LacI family DNA-binding transcriptional regulator [Vicinamibacterales bacterium]